MPLPTGLTRDEKSGIFHLRIGVPEDIQPYWPRQANGKMAVNAYRRSLQTRDRAEAIMKANALLADYQQQFAAIKDLRRPQFTRLTPELVAHLQERFKHRILRHDDFLRALSPAQAADLGTPASLSDELNDVEALQAQAQNVKRLVAKGDHGLTVSLMNDQLNRMGLPPANWLLHPIYLAQAGRTIAATFQAWADRASGELIDTPPPPQPYVPEAASPRPQEPQAPSKTLRDVVSDWTRLNNSSLTAIQDTNKALALWEEAVGSVPLDQITRKTGGEFVLYLLDEERTFKRKTAKNHASCINALMNIAARQGLVPTNPLDLKFTIDDSAEREPWTPEQLLKLHGKPPQGEQPLEVDPADADLLMNMLLWSGARISEIAGLRVQDIQERDGILAAYIRRETTKNDQSVRWLPVATALRQRIQAHVQRRNDEGSTALFPSFYRRAGTGPGDMAGRWFRLHRERLGLPPGHLNGSHKWRHTVRTTLAGQGLGEALLDAVTGHLAAGGSAGRKNYTHADRFPLVKVLEAVDRLAWPWPSRPAEFLQAA